ncbi:MAG: hypothetical protein KGL35_08365 [Bradyrhizobium sp.]|nr:hypothetical protein [Bradyrhizobium sp.]
MADVKVNLAPSEELIAKAVAEQVVEDSTGRIITLRKPGVLAQYRLVEMMGSAAQNQVYMGMVLPLLYVSAINDDKLPALSSKREVEALIQRLDEAGIEAVMKGVQEHFGAPDPEADKAALKN